jgi:3-dehydroquinate dehydratase
MQSVLEAAIEVEIARKNQDPQVLIDALAHVNAREPFRRHSYFSDIAAGSIVGLGAQGYELALQAALDRLDATTGEK